MKHKECVIRVELKSGITPEEIDTAMDAIRSLPHIDDVTLDDYSIEYPQIYSDDLDW